MSEKKINWVYVGSTNNLHRRLTEHKKGKVLATKGFRPLKLIYQEEYPNISLARKREYFLKGWQGRKIKKKIIENYKIACLRKQI